MKDRSFSEPAEYVIWGASALLALLLGTGSAFALWAALRHSDSAHLATAAVVSLAVGVGLIGLAFQRPIHRVGMLLFALSLVGCYLLEPHTFAAILP